MCYLWLLYKFWIQVHISQDIPEQIFHIFPTVLQGQLIYLYKLLKDLTKVSFGWTLTRENTRK
jgi:hypothetical protein